LTWIEAVSQLILSFANLSGVTGYQQEAEDGQRHLRTHR
jgi:hypothetical protein